MLMVSRTSNGPYAGLWLVAFSFKKASLKHIVGIIIV